MYNIYKKKFQVLRWYIGHIGVCGYITNYNYKQMELGRLDTFFDEFQKFQKILWTFFMGLKAKNRFIIVKTIDLRHLVP